MKNGNKTSPTGSTLSKKNNISQKNDDQYTNVLKENRIKDSHKFNPPPPKYFIDLDINKKRKESTQTNESNLIDEPNDPFLIPDEYLQIPPNISYKGFDFSKKFIQSRFIGVNKEIPLSDLEKILQFFSIIDSNIEEKPLVLQGILPLCKIDDETYDSEKLKETLLDSFKKSPKSPFWSEIANCILSSRMNGKKGFVFKRSSKKKTDDKLKDDSSYTSSDENPEKKKLRERRKNAMNKDTKPDQKPDKNKKVQFSKKDDQKRFNFSDDEKEENDDEFSKLDKILFDEEVSDDHSSSFAKLLFDDDSEGEIEGQISNKVQRKKFIISSDDEFIANSEEEKKPKKKNDHLSKQKVPSPHKKRKNRKDSLKSNKGSEFLSEYEYSYYSEEHVEKSNLTFEDLIRLNAHRKFERKEFQKIADEEINSRSFSSLESIDYENDEDWFIKTKKRWKHKKKINSKKQQNSVLTERNINVERNISLQKKSLVKNAPKKRFRLF